MAGQYASSIATVISSLTRKGAVGVLRSIAGVETSVLAVRVKVITHTLLDSKIQVGDIQYILAPTDTSGNAIAPQESDRFTLGSDTNIVVLTDPIKPALDTVAWYIYARVG